MSLDNRELALVYWLGVTIVFLLYKKETRASLGGLLRTLLSPSVLVLFMSLVAWVGLLTLALYQLGLWRLSLLPETLLWFLGPALIALHRLTNSGNNTGFLLNALGALLGFTLLLEFVMNLRPAPLLVELFLVPLLIVTVGVHVVASRDPDHQGTRRAMDFLLALIGFTLLGYTIIGVVQSPREYASVENLRELLLPLLLSLGYLPFAYLVALTMTYGTLFYLLNWKLRGSPNKTYAKWRAIVSSHLRLGILSRFARSFPFQLTDAMERSEIDRVARQLKRAR